MIEDGFFDHKQKNDWRGWAWNQIHSRALTLGYDIRETAGLYLAGPDDIDRQKALSKGFCDENLYAISHDDRVCRAIRSLGGWACCCEIGRVFVAWDGHPELSFLLLDFMSGLTENSWRTLFNAVMLGGSPAGKFTIIVINMLRGRDPWSNEIRVQTREIFKEAKCKNIPPLPHRGTASLLAIVNEIVRLSPLLGEAPLFQAWTNTLRPAFFTYRSRTQTFDSVALNIMTQSKTLTSVGEARWKVTETRRLIAAAKAVYTRSRANTA